MPRRSHDRSAARGARRRAVLTVITALSALAAGAGASGADGGPVLPKGFEITEVAAGLNLPVDLVFAPDGRMFVAEQGGVVWVIEDGEVLEEPFVDLSEEVNGQAGRGLLGITLDPAFLDNFRVYLLYTVDPVFGEPDEDAEEGSFGRLTRYTGTVASNGNVADPKSRHVLIGETMPEGIPICTTAHTIGTVRFGLDGTLLISAGDGARFIKLDSGGLDPECFGPGKFGKDEDIGAFRSQYLDSLAGKILRIDPESGLGLPTNPYWTGDGTDKRSKVWVSGLRNPFRFCMRPLTSGPGPGTLYIGDVGYAWYEEVSVAYGGENLGWPCFEGFHPSPTFPEPAHSGCDSIETPENPGPLTCPLFTWHHTDAEKSDPPGITARCVIGGVFYEGSCYPELYRGAYFSMAQRLNWIRVTVVDDDDALVDVYDFAQNIDGPVDLEMDPLRHDLHVVSIDEGKIRRISYAPDCPADIDGNCSVDTADLVALLAAWGPCAGCPEDVDGSGAVDVADLLILLGGWGSCG